MSREKLYRRICREEGCNGTSFTPYANQRELKQINPDWKCLRHSRPERVLSENNLVRENQWTLTKLDAPGLYWVKQGDKSGSGFFSEGDSIAHQEDFPEGTKIVVRVEVILP